MEPQYQPIYQQPIYNRPDEVVENGQPQTSGQQQPIYYVYSPHQPLVQPLQPPIYYNSTTFYNEQLQQQQHPGRHSQIFAHPQYIQQIHHPQYYNSLPHPSRLKRVERRRESVHVGTNLGSSSEGLYEDLRKDKLNPEMRVTFKDPNYNDLNVSLRSDESRTTMDAILESQTSFRVLIIALILSLVHICGAVVAIIVILKYVSDPDLPDKPQNHICTTALFCPFYKIVTGLTGSAIQFAGSVSGLAVNLVLLLGLMADLHCAILFWLICYSVGITGCILLFGIMMTILLRRQEEQDDVSTETMCLTILPAAMALLYLICWMLVFKLWKRMKERQDKVFQCLE